jgi:hypothetical protein
MGLVIIRVNLICKQKQFFERAAHREVLRNARFLVILRACYNFHLDKLNYLQFKSN